MNLFKKKEKKECCCSQIDQESIIKAEESKKEDGIKILGSGCKKCEKLEESVKKAVIELNLNLPISHITGVLQLNNINFFETLDIALFFCQFFCIFYSYFLVLCDIIVSGGVSYG